MLPMHVLYRYMYTKVYLSNLPSTCKCTKNNVLLLSLTAVAIINSWTFAFRLHKSCVCFFLLLPGNKWRPIWKAFFSTSAKRTEHIAHIYTYTWLWLTHTPVPILDCTLVQCAIDLGHGRTLYHVQWTGKQSLIIFLRWELMLHVSSHHVPSDCVMYCTPDKTIPMNSAPSHLCAFSITRDVCVYTYICGYTT